MRTLALVVAAVTVCGCPSKEGEQRDAQSGTSPPVASASASPSAATQTGHPLAQLESSTATDETWTTDDGRQEKIVFYARENVRASASCRGASGQISCEALRFLRTAGPVELPRRALDGRQSAGVKVCTKLSHPVVVAHTAGGSEDSFCKFPDGSLVSNGALERYALKVSD